MAGRAAGISGIKVVDPMTIQFTLDKARPYFVMKLNCMTASILPKEICGLVRIADINHAVGTGPFRIGRYLTDEEVDLEANAQYYLGPPKLKGIVRTIIKDASTRMNLYRHGDLDVLTVQRNDVKAAQDDPQLSSQMVFQARPQIFYIGLNETSFAPLKDRRVRQALAMAIDRERICKVLLGGVPVAKAFVAPGVIGYKENFAGLPFDPAQARELLTEAGYPGGKGLPALHLTFRSQTPDSQRVCEAVAANLRQNLGMDVQLSEMEWTAFLDARNKRKLEGYFLWWSADYLDPQNFLSILLRSDSPHNYDGYRNVTFDQDCNIGDSTLDETIRAKAYEAANAIAVEDAARIPLFFQREALLISPRVHNLRCNLFGMMPDLSDSVE
jgi:ABC-type transport system substrate-binding protein